MTKRSKTKGRIVNKSENKGGIKNDDELTREKHKKGMTVAFPKVNDKKWANSKSNRVKRRSNQRGRKRRKHNKANDK